MADTLGSLNHIKYSSIVKQFSKAAGASADQALNSIVVPNLGDATIIIAKINLNIVSLNADNDLIVRLEGAQSIQVKESAAGAFIDGVTLPDNALETKVSGAGSYYLPGSIDVIAQVAAFNKTYDFQWNDLDFEGDDVDLSVIVELDIWFTLNTSYGDSISEILYSTAGTKGTVNAVGGTTTVFKTSLAGYFDDHFNNLQIVFYSGGNTIQARRISDFVNVNGVVTVSEALNVAPLIGDQFIIAPRYTGAGTTITDASVADAVWDELLSGHVVAGSSGKAVADIESDATLILADTDEIQGKLPSSTYLKGTADSDGGMDTNDKADVNTEVDDALNTAIPGAPTADSINERVVNIDTDVEKIFDADMGSAPTTDSLADKLMNKNVSKTFDKTADSLEAISDRSTTIASDVVTIDTVVDNIIADTERIFDLDMGSTPTTDSLADKVMNKDGSQTFDKTTDSLEAQRDNVDSLIGTPVTDVSTDIATNLTAITSIQNNTRFAAAIPEQMQKPDSSNRAFRWTGNLYDTDGNMEDPNDNEILVRVLQADGTAITANLYKEQALTNPLANATDQVNFPSGSGWRAMERLGVGQFDLFYKVAHDETEEALTVEFGWEEGTSIIKQTRSTEVVDYAGDIEDIQAKVDAMYIKTDAVTPSPTIPDQITTHDTDIKALPNVKATPEFLVIPSGVTRINIEGGITAIATTIALYDSSVLQSVGIVKIGTELITYTGISSNNELTGCTRGAYSTTPAIHADQAAVYEVVIYPLRLMVYDNAGNMKAPDSAPTIEIVDWAGTQELAPTAMTLISTGLYGYDYFMYQTDSPESKTLRFSIIVNAITTLRHSTLMVLDTPASSSDVIDLVGGGTGEFAVTENGWYDNDGILTEWTDDMKGYLKDSVTGSRLDDVLITAYEVINGLTIRAIIPPGQTVGNVSGQYEMRLDAGTYVFKFYKDQYQFPTDEVTRVIT